MYGFDKWQDYYDAVKCDYEEAKEKYPFMDLVILPTREMQTITITAIAVEKNMIEKALARREDFMGEYSKKIVLVVRNTYKTEGCIVYGASWVKKEMFQNKDWHFFADIPKTKDGYAMCVGTPESFRLMKNVVLEAVKTADAMLVAYERVMRGIDHELYLTAYAHGKAGREQFKSNKKRYIPR